MKKYAFAFLLLIFPALVFADAALVEEVVSGAAAAGNGYAYEQGFEGVGVPDGWVIIDETGTNDPDFDYTTNPPVGSKSLYMPDPGGSGNNKISVQFPSDYDEVWVSFILVIDTGVAAAAELFRFTDTGSTDVGSAEIRSDDYGLRVAATDGFTASTNSPVTLSGGTYYIMIRGKKGTGNTAEIEVWVTEDTSSWTHGGAAVSSTDGDFTTQMRFVIFQNYYPRNFNIQIDQVVIHTSEIPISYYQ